MNETDSIKIGIIGNGNVGFHLNKAFSKHFFVEQLNSRDIELNSKFDIILICVSDSAIEDVASSLSNKLIEKGYHQDNVIVAHTSAATSVDILTAKFSHAGVLYPLQTFSKGRNMVYEEIPFYINSKDDFAKETLSAIANRVSNNLKYANDDMLTALHVGAVFCCNFVNHLINKADEFLKNYNLDYTELLPLIDETVAKLHRIAPEQAQTGPAIRKDMTTISKHLNMLNNNPGLTDLYNYLTSSIMQKK